MFWERSDSTLSDEVLRGLRDIKVDDHVVQDLLDTVRPDDMLLPNSLSDGTFARAFKLLNPARDPDLVLRLGIRPAVNSQAFHLDQWVNNEAIARAFPTPRIVHVDTSRTQCPYPFQIIEYSDGISLRSANEAGVQKVLSDLGAALARLHAKPIGGDRWGRVGLGTFPEWNLFWMYNMDADAHHCMENGLITTDQFDQVYAIGDTDVVYWGVEGAALLHGDLSYDNILVKDGHLHSVIDWEDAVLGDPIFELAGLATFHPESRHSTFLDAYYGGSQRPDGFGVRFWTYYLRISLAKAVHRHRFRYASPDRRPDHQHPDDRIGLALSRLKDL